VVRELVANALLHRDLGPHALGMSITLRLEPHQLVISNPGGLFGIRVDSLGSTPSSLRNARLAELLRFTRDTDDQRVIERLGSGIPTVRETLNDAGMAPAFFHDQGVRFTVRVQAGPARAADTADLTDRERRVLAAVNRCDGTVKRIVATSGLPERAVRVAVERLTGRGLLSADRLDGRTKRYRVQ
jgi:ATP-dependent DNA helicase RecG